jgi:hypothetical protein
MLQENLEAEILQHWLADLFNERHSFTISAGLAKSQ